MTEANSPLILYSGGIPIAPADLDFGNSITGAQINALSSFSRMVNAIPAEETLWVPTGSQTWDVYDLVLTMAQFAESAQGQQPATSVFNTRAVLVAGSNATVNMVEPNQQLKDSAPSSLAVLGQNVAPLLEQIGFHFSAARAAPRVSAFVLSPQELLTAPAAQAMGLAAMFLQLRAHLATATMTDTLGNTFYPTPLYPANFYQPQYDASWQTFEITPGQADPWLPVSNGASVSGEMVTIPLQRAWWSTWIFSSRGWQFNPSAGLGALADGGHPPQGMMPMYASAVIFARNIKVTPAPGAAAVAAPASASFTPRSATATQAARSAAGQFGPQLVDAPTSMLIIGFVCTPLPQCPNPDPTLDWES